MINNQKDVILDRFDKTHCHDLIENQIPAFAGMTGKVDEGELSYDRRTVRG